MSPSQTVDRCATLPAPLSPFRPPQALAIKLDVTQFESSSAQTFDIVLSVVVVVPVTFGVFAMTFTELGPLYSEWKRENKLRTHHALPRVSLFAFLCGGDRGENQAQPMTALEREMRETIVSMDDAIHYMEEVTQTANSSVCSRAARTGPGRGGTEGRADSRKDRGGPPRIAENQDVCALSSAIAHPCCAPLLSGAAVG